MLCDVCEDTLSKTLDSDWRRRFNHHSSYASLCCSATDGCFICSGIKECITEGGFPTSPHFPRALTAWVDMSGRRTPETDCLRIDVWLDLCDASYSSQYSSNETSRRLSTGLCFKRVFLDDPSFRGEAKRLQTVFSNNTGSAETISQIVDWTKLCKDNHRLCNEGREGTWMPSRLLELSDVSGDLRVHLRDRSHLGCGRYLTLSHCWGPTATQKLQLKKDSIDLFHGGIAVSSLKQTFRDMATLTWQLGVRLMWIDCMCIIQDDAEDWKRESALMGQIYTNSWLNISANAAADGHSGLFADRNGSRLRDWFAIRTRKGHETFIFAVTEREPWWKEVESAPVNKRAWVLQERILSPRIVHMSQTLALWECRHLQASEVFPEGQLPDQDSCKNYGQIRQLYDGSQLRSQADVRAHWWKIVSRYAMCDITFETDRLIALSGIASEIHKRIQSDYLAGIWSESLPVGLLWHVHDEKRARAQEYVAPSWSWASTRGYIQPPLEDATELVTHTYVTILKYELVLANPTDMFGRVIGGMIKLRVPLGNLDWTAEACATSKVTQYRTFCGTKISVPSESGEMTTIAECSTMFGSGGPLSLDALEYGDLRTAYLAVFRSYQFNHDETTNGYFYVQGLLLNRLPCSSFVRIGLAELFFNTDRDLIYTGTDQDFVGQMPYQDIVVV